jgi:hypothetical protein
MFDLAAAGGSYLRVFLGEAIDRRPAEARWEPGRSDAWPRKATKKIMVSWRQDEASRGSRGRCRQAPVR